jgi:hypothetical protein
MADDGRRSLIAEEAKSFRSYCLACKHSEWLMIPLLRAAEARWAATVSPARAETPPPDPWPYRSRVGRRNCDHDLPPHVLAFHVGVGVVLAGSAMVVA